jgi:hypothetical protein
VHNCPSHDRLKIIELLALPDSFAVVKPSDAGRGMIARKAQTLVFSLSGLSAFGPAFQLYFGIRHKILRLVFQIPPSPKATAVPGP